MKKNQLMIVILIWMTIMCVGNNITFAEVNELKNVISPLNSDINVTSIVEGETYRTVKQYDLNWTSIYPENYGVNIYIMNENGSSYQMYDRVQNGGHTTMSIPFYGTEHMENGNGYYIKIELSGDTSIFGESARFTLEREWVELETEITKDQRVRETEVKDISIAYMSSGLTEVKLFNRGEFVKDLATPYSGGSLGQTVSILWGDLPDDFNYTIKVENPGAYVESEQFVIIGDVELSNVQIPDEDPNTVVKELTVGANVQISWELTGDIKEFVVYYGISGVRYEIYKGVGISTSVQWTVPNYIGRITLSFESSVHGLFSYAFGTIQIRGESSIEGGTTSSTTSSIPKEPSSNGSTPAKVGEIYVLAIMVSSVVVSTKKHK